MLPDQHGGMCCVLRRYGYNSQDVKDVLAGKIWAGSLAWIGHEQQNLLV